MKTLSDILATLRREKPQLERRYGVRSLAVFGSYARGDQRVDSDVDILVEVDPAIGLRFVDLAEHLESVLGTRSEVVSRRALRPASWNRIRDELVDVG
jgi:predicted nucleotidyltransferase